MYEGRLQWDIISDKNSDVLMRRRQFSDGTPDQMFLEMEVMGVKPEQFLHVFKNTTTLQTKWNPNCKSSELFKVDEGANIIVSKVKPPVALLSLRVIIGA